VEDEHADRVYVPGTNPAPPDRDVEPFWAQEELEAPVHGGRPVPHEAPPAIPLPPAEGGVYRPLDRSGPMAPIPLPHHGPIPHQRPAAPPPFTQPPAAPPPAAPPPFTQPPVVQAPVAQPPMTQPPVAQPPPSLPESGSYAASDSPWSQPPHRPAHEPAHAGPDPAAPDPAVPDPAATAPPRATASVSVPGAARPGYYPTVTPREPSEDTAGEAHNGAIYRPGPPYPAQPHPVQPNAAPPHPAPPHPAPPHPAPPHPAPPHPAPPHPAPPHPAPPQAAHGGQPPGPTMPGPYPPTVDPRALPPQQPHPGPGAADPFQDLPWVSDGTPTAEEFARRRMAKPAEPTATMGARALLRKGTMGLVKLAPGRHEQEYKQDVEMVRRNFGGLRQVTVVNPKGGAGKTVAVLLLAMTFGQKRGGYVLAWDNNETQGTLGMRAQQDFHARTVRDMMRDLHLFRGAHGRVGDLSQYVRAQGEGMFDVLASDESATAGEMLTASAFGEIREIVSRFYKLIFVDTGNNVRAENWQAAMDATDQLVITMSARNDSAETAARMLDHLEQSGRQRLVRQAVSIVSMPPTRKDIDLPAIQRHFAARTRAVLLAPYEKLIDSGEPLRYGQLSANTKDAWLKIAAAVAEGL